MKRDCEICGSNKKEIIYNQRFVAPSKNQFHSGYSVVICKTCGFVFADRIPAKNRIREYYRAMAKKSFYLHTNINSEKENETSYKMEMSQRFVKTLQNITFFARKKDSVLDVGCYTGELMFLLKKRGYRHLTGIDPSPTAVKIAQKKYGLDILESNMYDGKIAEKYQVVLLTHVLEHIPDLRNFMNCVGKNIQVGGMVYIESPDADNFFISDSGRYLPEHREPYQQFSMEHVNFFTKLSLFNLMTSLGYQLKFLQSQVSVVATIASWWQKATPLVDDQTSFNIKNYLANSARLLLSVEKHIKKLSKEGKLYVWGAGGYTQKMLAQTSMRKLSIVAFIDSNPDYHGGMLNGKKIVAPEKIKSMPIYPILISTNAYQKKIIKQIKTMGLKNKILILEKQ